MKTETKPEVRHTPLPWRAELSTVYGPLIDPLNPDGPDDPICSVINKTDAAFIVRAVNCHEKLLEVAKGVNILEQAMDVLASLDTNKIAEEVRTMLSAHIFKTKRIIAKAEEK